MIKWIGQPTDKRLTWKAEAETFKELAEILEEKGLIQGLYSEHGQGWIERWTDFTSSEDAAENMTEDDWNQFILDNDGMAYYQQIEVEAKL